MTQEQELQKILKENERLLKENDLLWKEVKRLRSMVIEEKGEQLI